MMKTAASYRQSNQYTEIVFLQLPSTNMIKGGLQYLAPIHGADEYLTARSREVSKPWDSGLDFSNRSEIWQAHQQHCCRDDC